MSKKNKKALKREEEKLPRSLSWQVQEYEKHSRDRRWYIIAALVAFGLLAWAILTKNYFFAIIIIIAAFILITHDKQEPAVLDFSLEPTGVRLAKRFYEYREFKNFAVIYRPKDNIRNLYLIFKNPVKPKLSIFLGKTNPLEVRAYLLDYLLEDLEMDDAPFSEGLSRLLKL